MGKCNFEAPNGEKSLLHAGLSQLLGEQAATLAWYRLKNLSTNSEEPSVNEGLQQLKLGTPEQVQTMQQFATRWKLTPIAGRLITYYATENLARAISKQLVKSGDIYKDIQIRFDKTHGLLELFPKQGSLEFHFADTAIPEHTSVSDFTKPTDSKTKTLAPDQVKSNINDFLTAALAASDKTFKVPYSGDAPNRKLYNGFTALDLAQMFAAHGSVPSNVVFEDSFKGLMGNLPQQFLGTEIILKDQTIRSTYPVNEDALRKAQAKIFVEIKDGTGQGTGKFFSADQQIEAVNNFLYEIQLQVRKNGSVRVGDSKEVIKNIYRALLSRYNLMAEGTRIMKDGEDQWPLIDQELAQSYKSNMENVLNSIDDLFKLVVQRLKVYSINVNDLSATSNDSLAGAIDDSAGRGLVDFNDEVFALDPKDTASGRLKMFVATLEDVEHGPVPRPKPIKLSLKEDARDAIAAGTKTTTFRTQEQAARDVKLTPGVLGQDTGLITIKDQQYQATATKYITESDAEAFNESADKEEFKAKEGDILIELKPYKAGAINYRVKNSFIGRPKLANLESILEKAFGVLSGQAPNFEAYMSALEADPNINMGWLAAKLRAASTGEEIRKEFVSVMTKAYQEFTILVFSQGKDKAGNPTTALRPINANRYSIKKTLITTWQEQQKMAPIISRQSGNYVVNSELVGKLSKQFDEVQAAIASVPKTSDKLHGSMSSEATKKATDFLKNMFTYNGIILPEAVYSKLILQMEKLTKTTDFPGNFFRQFQVSADGTPNGLFSIFMNSLKNSIDTESDETSMLTQNNPLYKETTTMEILAGLYAQHTDVLYSSTHRDSQGKTVWDYSLNTFLSHTVRELTADTSRYRTDLLSTDYAKNNWLLEQLETNANARKNFSVDYLDGIKNQYGKDSGVTRSEMSNREQLLLSMGLFQNNGRKGTNFLSLTHSDKTKTPVFRGILKLPVVTRGELSNKAIDRLYDTFKGEFDRIARVASAPKGTYKHVQYEKGAHLFYQIPIFNKSEMQQAVKEERITPEDMALVWNPDGSLNTKDTLDPRFKEVTRNMLKSFGTELGAAMEERFRNEGLLTDTSHMFDTGYVVNKLEPQSGVQAIRAGDTMSYIDRTGKTQNISQEEYIRRIGKAAALDYAVNSFLFNTALSQLILGDPAQVFKANKKVNTDMGNVESTMQEYQKRLAGIIAPGKDGAVARDEVYHTVTLADLEVGLDYLNSVPAYAEKVNLTDAQEITTMAEHLYVMSYYGVIKDTIYQEMKKIIDDAGPGGYYEFEKQSHKDVVLQIMKPVYYGARNAEDGAMLHDYVKSSSYPLYPPFTKGLEIDKLRVQMEKRNIQRANFISAKKIGASGAVQIFNQDRTINEGAFGTEQWNAALQNLQRGGLRLQQDTPYDEEKEQILTVSQMDVLITQGIADMSDFKLADGTTMSGEELIKHKADIRKALIDKNLDKFADKIGAARVNSNLVIQDQAKFLNRLVDAAKARGYNDNDIAAITVRATDGSPIIPIFLSSAADTYESLMMSMVNDIVKVKVDGKSFIQAASAGIKRISNDVPTGIVWSTSHDGKDLKMMRREDGTIKAAEILVPFNFFTKKGRVDIKDFLKPDGTLDTDKVPLELLDMVGARIPCQGHNSMIAFTIAGFLPANMGDMIVVPEGITTQMGSDFDVDKLYTYRRPHTYKDGKFTSETTDEVDKLKSHYFDIHWSILTHPQMFDEVTKPLDNDDMKEEAAKAPSPNKTSFFDVGRQLDDFSSQKDAKRMVAYYALNTKFSALSENKDMSLGHFDTENALDGSGDQFKIIPDPITIFRDEITNKPIELLSLSKPATGTIISDDGTHHVRTKHDNIRTQLSEVVDHAKNRTIDKLNLTVYTQPVAAAISLLGSDSGTAATLKHVSRFLQQEGAKMYSVAMAKSSDSLSEYTTNVKERVISDITSFLMNKSGENGGTTKAYSPEELLYLAHTPEGNKDRNYWQDQLNLWNTFIQFEHVGERISQMQGLLNQGVNGAGPNMLTVLDKLSKFGDVLADDTIINGMNLYTGTETGKTFDATIHTAATVYDDLLPYSKLKPLVDKINQLQGNRSQTEMSLDTKRSIVQAMKSFVFSGIHEDIQAERARLLYKTDQGPSLAERVLDAQNTTWGKKNYFLMRLRPALNLTSPSHVQYIASKVTSMDDLENIRGWMSMLGSEDKEIRFLGEDLLKYTYLNGGVQDANSFTKYIPFGYTSSTDIPEYLRNSFDNIGEVSDAFIRQWFQHNPNKAKSLSDNFKETGRTIEKLPEMFNLPAYIAAGIQTNPAKDLVVKEGKDKNYAQYLSYRDKASNRWILYMRTNDGTQIEGPQYTRIDTLGDKNTDEYNREAGVQRSIIPVNRSFIAPVENSDDIILPEDPQDELTEAIHSVPDIQVHDKWKKVGITSALTTPSLVRSQILDTIANNVQAPMIYRALAKHLQGLSFDFVMMNLMHDFQNIHGIEQADSPSIRLVDKDGARFTYPNMEIALSNNPVTLAHGSATEILLHEMVHAYTIPYVDLFYPMWLKTEKGNTLRAEAVDSSPTGFDVIHKSVIRLEELRQQAIKHLGTEGSIIMKHGLSNVAEFIAHATTNKEFMQALNEIEAEGTKTFFSKIIDAVANLFETISEYLGKPINKNSILHEALVNTQQLFDFNEQGVITTTEGTSIANDNSVSANYMQAVSNTLMDQSKGPWKIVTDPQDLKDNAAKHFPDVDVHSVPTDIPGTHSISFEYSAKISKIDKVGKTISALNEQLDHIKGSFTGQITKEERADKQQKIKEIEDAIKELTDKGDIALIPKIAAQQLKWVQSTLDKDNPSPNDIMTSLRVVELWSGALSLLYGPDATGTVGTAPDDLKKVVGDAINMSSKLNAEVMRKAFNELSQSKALTTPEYQQKLEDMDQFSAYALSVNRATSLLTQEVSLLMQNTARARDQESVALVERLGKLQKMMEQAAGSKSKSALSNLYDQFIQTNSAGNAWGIVGRYSQDWYDYRSEARDTRIAQIDKIRKMSTDATKITDNKKIRKVWESYWNKIDKAAIFIDTTKFFNEDGELKAGHEKYRDELVKEVGAEYADQQIAKAQERYKQYLDDKEAADVDIETKILMGEYTEEEANRHKNDWFEAHSPDLFFKNKSGESFTANNRGEWYSVITPRKSGGKFYDENYAEIMKDKGKMAIYNEIRDLLETHTKMLPLGVQKDLGANFLPVVQNHLVNDVSNIKEWMENMSQKAIDALTATEFEQVNASSPRIPIRFVNKGKFIKDGKLQEGVLSNDLPRIIEIFGLMALHYKHFSRAKDGIDMGHAILRYIDMQRRAGTEPGKALGNTLAAVEYMRDHLMYKKPKALEGNTGKKIYSLNPRTQSKISSQVKELLEQRHDVEQKYVNPVPGEPAMSMTEYNEQVAEINKKIEGFGGQNIYASKLGDALIKINQVKALAFNPFSGFANLTFGMVSMYTYANGRQDFNIRETHQAMNLMRSSMKKWWTMGKYKGETAEKIVNVINRVGIENDIVDSQYGEGNIPGRKSTIKKIIKPFELLRSTDFYMKGTITVAMLLHSQITVEKDGAPTKMSMWDALGNDGNFKYPVPEEWQSKDVTKETEWNKYRNKAIRVNQIIMGNMDKNSPKLLQKKVLGRLVAQFRLSWLPEGFAARFEGEKHDIQLGRDIKGRYRTYADLGWMESTKVQLKQLAGIIMKVDPFTGVRRLDGKPLSDVDMENMRRNFTGLLWTCTAMMSIMALRALIPPKDEDDGIFRETMMITMNMMNRLNQDLQFYSSPDVANTIIRNVIPAMDVVNDYIKATSAFNKALFNEDYGWDKAGLKFTHATPYLNLINKFKYMASRDISTLSR